MTALFISNRIMPFSTVSVVLLCDIIVQTRARCQVEVAVLAKYDADGAWYRARIEQVLQNGMFIVLYTDYREKATVDLSMIKLLEKAPFKDSSVEVAPTGEQLAAESDNLDAWEHEGGFTVKRLAAPVMIGDFGAEAKKKSKKEIQAEEEAAKEANKKISKKEAKGEQSCSCSA